MGLFDSIRAGIADMDGAPHYFACQFDADADDYTEDFKLYPVGPEFMQRAMRQMTIFRDWERKFHAGLADLQAHPGHGGIDAEYDELTSWLDAQVRELQALPTLYRAAFRVIPSQEHLPRGVFRNMEVAWSPSAA